MSPLVLMKMGDRGRAELVGSMARVITWSPTRVKGRMSVKATLLAGMTSSVVLETSPVLPEADGIPAWSRGMKDISTEIMSHEVIKTDDGMMEIRVHECGCSVIISR